MKRAMTFARFSRRMFALSLIMFACFASARAGVVIPRVCVAPNYQTGAVTLTGNEGVGANVITLSADIPNLAGLVINPGGTNEEQVPYAVPAGSGGGTRRMLNFDSSIYTLTRAHSAGETVQWITDTEAFFGYNNTINSTVTIPRGSISNFFLPGPLSYAQQPSQFLPGIHDNVLSIKIISGLGLTWIIDGLSASAVSAPPCGTITYQGRLSDAGAAANGQYDLRFTAFDALTGGTAQSGSVVVENAQVTDGVFTVQLPFGASFFNNNNARLLEIGVRPGAATGNDPFTLLTPRQPITPVPFAINAQTATNVSGGFVRLPLTANAPPAAECNDTSMYGRMKVDATNNKLYVCTTTGWKAFVPQ